MNRPATILLPVIVMMFLASCNTEKRYVSELNHSIDKVSSQIEQKYSEGMIDGLPEPVQRYFRFALNEGQSFVKQVSLNHKGTFKTKVGGEWLDISGSQHFNTGHPGFAWIGKTSMFTAHDLYINNAGALKVYLFGWIRIVNETGPYNDQGELLRWLGESVWFPTNLLPSKNLTWTPIDENNARVTFIHGNLSIWYDVRFDESGAITELSTERYMEEDRLEQWTGRLGNWKNAEGMQVPMYIEAAWQLDEGEHCYARFDVAEIQYRF